MNPNNWTPPYQMFVTHGQATAATPGFMIRSCPTETHGIAQSSSYSQKTPRLAFASSTVYTESNFQQGRQQYFHSVTHMESHETTIGSNTIMTNGIITINSSSHNQPNYSGQQEAIPVMVNVSIPPLTHIGNRNVHVSANNISNGQNVIAANASVINPTNYSELDNSVHHETEPSSITHIGTPNEHVSANNLCNGQNMIPAYRPITNSTNHSEPDNSVHHETESSSITHNTTPNGHLSATKGYYAPKYSIQHETKALVVSPSNNIGNLCGNTSVNNAMFASQMITPNGAMVNSGIKNEPNNSAQYETGHQRNQPINPIENIHGNLTEKVFLGVQKITLNGQVINIPIYRFNKVRYETEPLRNPPIKPIGYARKKSSKINGYRQNITPTNINSNYNKYIYSVQQKREQIPVNHLPIAYIDNPNVNTFPTYHVSRQSTSPARLSEYDMEAMRQIAYKDIKDEPMEYSYFQKLHEGIPAQPAYIQFEDSDSILYLNPRYKDLDKPTNNVTNYLFYSKGLDLDVVNIVREAGYTTQQKRKTYSATLKSGTKQIDYNTTMHTSFESAPCRRQYGEKGSGISSMIATETRPRPDRASESSHDDEFSNYNSINKIYHDMITKIDCAMNILHIGRTFQDVVKSQTNTSQACSLLVKHVRNIGTNRRFKVHMQRYFTNVTSVQQTHEYEGFINFADWVSATKAFNLLNSHGFDYNPVEVFYSIQGIYKGLKQQLQLSIQYKRSYAAERLLAAM